MAEKYNLKGEEKILFTLRSLYSSFGYRTYKMSRFEEYDLYARNKDFLVSGNVITFTDTDGKLMALKPDVTLSIVRSVKDQKGSVSRICYGENVYRVSENSGTFREIMQAGLECIGDVGLLELSEVVNLAQMSLRAISEDSILTISHMGIVQSLLSDIPDQIKADAIRYLSSRNLSALADLSKENPDCADTLKKVSELPLIGGSCKEVLQKLKSMGCDRQSLSQLKSVVDVLDQSKTRIDFSILDGMKYYNGIVFRGYVKGVPVPVVSGGQYDKLMRRMKRSSRAIGFAVYLDALERLVDKTPQYDVDTVLLYDENDDIKKVLAKAQSLRKGGKTVVTMRSVPENLRFAEAVKMGGGKDA